MGKQNHKHNSLDKIFNRVDAQFYSINNPYLNLSQKVEVMCWYCLPGNFMRYTFMGLAIYSVFHPLWWGLFLIAPVLVNIVISILNWHFYYRPISLFLGYTVFYTFIDLAITVAVSVFLWNHGRWLLGIISLLGSFGIFVFLELHILLYGRWSRRYQMNPQYAFFKRFYNMTFPFEENQEKLD